MWVYIGTSELKNAYIGKVHEYDFTKSDWWWTLDSWVTRDSNWLYLTSSSQYVDSYSAAPNIIYSWTPSKITVTYYKSQSSTGTWIGDWMSAAVWLPRNQYNLNYLSTNLNWTISNINLWANPTGNIVWEMDIDSSTTNWTVTHKITWVSAVTETSWALKTLFTNQSLKIRIVDWKDTTSIRIKSIVIEY